MVDDGGLARIQQRMNAIPAKVREAAAKASREAAEKVADDMRHFALSSKDTGALIDSITVTGPNEKTPPYSQPGGAAVVPEGTYRITAGNKDVRYAHLVEYGTKASTGRGGGRDRRYKTRIVKTRKYGAHPGTPAQPFFWPAVRANKKKVASAIRKAAREAIKEGWGKK